MADENLHQPVIKEYLGEYTEKVLLPARSNLLDEKFDEKLEPLKTDIQKLRNEMQALSAKVTNYLELSDKRYLELKYRNTVVAKWVKQIADKAGVEIDLAELEKY